MYGLCLLFHRYTVKLSNCIFHETREALRELCRWCQMDGHILTVFNVSTTNIRHEAKYFMLILNVVRSPQYWQCRGCWTELKTYYIAACLSTVMFYHYWTLSLSILSSLPVEVPGEYLEPHPFAECDATVAESGDAGCDILVQEVQLHQDENWQADPWRWIHEGWSMEGAGSVSGILDQGSTSHTTQQ